MEKQSDHLSILLIDLSQKDSDKKRMRFLIAIIFALGIGATIPHLVLLALPAFSLRAKAIATLMLMTIFPICCCGSAYIWHRVRKARKIRDLEKIEDWDERFRAEIMSAKRWPFGSLYAGDVVQLLTKYRFVDGKLVVVTEGLDWQTEVGAHRFEPEVISALDLKSWIISLLGVFVGLSVLPLLFAALGYSPGGTLNTILNRALGIFIVASSITLFALIRNRYLRVAPRRVQLLETRPWRKEPTIRDYPIEPGTTIVLRRMQRQNFSIARGYYADQFSFTGEHFEHNLDLLRRAIFTTVRAPEMSTTDLVG